MTDNTVNGNVALPEKDSTQADIAASAGSPADSFAALSPDIIIEAIERDDQLLCDGRLLALNSYENRVYRVGIEDGAPLIAKFYRPQRWTEDQINEEQRKIVRHFAENGYKLDSIKGIINAAKVSEYKIFTPKQQFDVMAKEFPLLKDFEERFNLDFNGH